MRISIEKITQNEIRNKRKVFDEFWEIYNEAFPLDEKRTQKDHIKIMDNENHNLNLFYDEDNLLGFMSSWDIEEYLYIEHLAMSSTSRGNGYGSEVFKQIKENNAKIVLEVEKPETEMQKRRILFYERQGFSLGSGQYTQPPLNEHGGEVELEIMTYPYVFNKSEIEKIKKYLDNNIHGDYSYKLK